MLTLNISQADIVSARYERIHHPIQTIRKRMDAIFQVALGYSRQEVADMSGVHRNSVRNYIKLYNQGGLDALMTFQYKGFDSMLQGHRITLDAYFRQYPPRCAKEAAAKVAELTGTRLSVEEVRRFMHRMGMKPRKTGHVPAKVDPLKQELFLQQRLLPLVEAAQQGKCHLFFVDAAHFVLQPFVGILWCFTRLFIKAAAGRSRINVLGALHFVSHKLETVVNTTYVNSETVGELLEKLARAYAGVPIYLVLDNARYRSGGPPALWVRQRTGCTIGYPPGISAGLLAQPEFD